VILHLHDIPIFHGLGCAEHAAFVNPWMSCDNAVGFTRLEQHSRKRIHCKQPVRARRTWLRRPGKPSGFWVRQRTKALLIFGQAAQYFAVLLLIFGRFDAIYSPGTAQNDDCHRHLRLTGQIGPVAQSPLEAA
jgi:hypothetical protein